MKPGLATILATVLAVSSGFCQVTKEKASTTGISTSLEQMFTKLENEWAKADNNKDAHVLDEILADDWTYLGATGIQTKAQHLAELKAGGGDLEFETLADIKVRIYGSMAVVTGSAYQKNVDAAKATSGHYIWTDVFIKRNGRWKAVNSQDTLISQK